MGNNSRGIDIIPCRNSSPKGLCPTKKTIDNGEKMCNDEFVKDREQMYQTVFNDTLSKLRLVISATGNEHLMKAVAKIMFDFSDCLKENNLLTDKEQKNDKNIYASSISAND